MKLHFWIVSFFALIGILTLSVMLHELSHFQDAKEYSKDKEICVFSYSQLNNLSWNGKFGYYRYSFEPKDIEKDNRVERYTEIKAYAISIIIISIGIFSLIEIYFFIVDNSLSLKSGGNYL